MGIVNKLSIMIISACQKARMCVMSRLSVPPGDMRDAVKEVCAALGPHPVITREIMRDLLDACKDRRIRASSSYNVYKQSLDHRAAVGGGMYVVVGDGIEIMISEMMGGGAYCSRHCGAHAELGVLNVIGSSLGGGGVWLSITGPGEFWLEIHVPIIAEREREACRK